MLHSQLVILFCPIGGFAPPAFPRPLRKQVVNKANSNDGLVPTNMLLLLPAGALVAPLHVNERSRKNCGCRWKGRRETKCSSLYNVEIKAISGNEDHVSVMQNHVR